MKKLNLLYRILAIVLWIDIVMVAECFSQTRVENDTLYTRYGNIYPGQELKFSTGTGRGNTYRFVRSGEIAVRSDYSTAKVVIEKVGRLESSSLNNVYIHLIVKVTFKDGSEMKSRIRINFNRAINPDDGFHPELML